LDCIIILDLYRSNMRPLVSGKHYSIMRANVQSK